MISPLRKLLEEEAGWEEFRMTIPHPFLPPRFQKLSKNRNMVLLLDRDMTLHVRWEGSRLHEHHPLTPGAARGLIREVSSRMTKYRREVQVFSRFIGQKAEEPFEDNRSPDPLRWKERELPAASRIEENPAQEVVANITVETRIGEALEAEHLLSKGGESPMGGFRE